ncbi:MAG: alpha-1,2-fucosyltransferase [Lachnospiraceae bacterium]|nr:alpha-1,2-fucosyltransferase [Lachnospiraceae bacterium]
MIIIRLQGGLGNQMFQYALLLQLKKLGREVKIDEKSGYEEDRLRRPVLREVFGLTYDEASEREIRTLRDAFPDPVSRIRRKLFGRRNLEWEEPDGRFHPEVLTLEEGYLNGYFQSEQYFPDPEVRALIREAFCPERKNLTGSAEAASLLEKIRGDGERSVSMHIRRGDYLLPETAKTHGGICTESYYERALALIGGQLGETSLYVFSDDPAFAETYAESCREKGISGGRIRVVCLTKEQGDRKDAAELMLMRACRHHVLANSSYSWWGAWLKEPHHGKSLLIAPGRWYQNRADDGIYTEEMTRI